jgi:hypothetical protein
MPIKVGSDPLAAVLDQIANLTPEDFRRLKTSLSASAKAAENREKTRVEKMQAAAADPLNLPTINYVNGTLRRLGLSIHAAENLVELDRALDKAKLSGPARIELKTAMARLAIID